MVIKQKLLNEKNCTSGTFLFLEKGKVFIIGKSGTYELGQPEYHNNKMYPVRGYILCSLLLQKYIKK